MSAEETTRALAPEMEDNEGSVDPTTKCLPETKEDEDCRSDDLVTPPDGGWGWVVVIAAFLTSVVVDGIIFSFGIVFPELTAQFEEGKSKTSWVGSTLGGTYLLVGPVVSAMANRFGCRNVSIVGSFIASVGFIISFWAPSIAFLTVTYGVIGGIGFGMVYLPSIVMVQFYFEKRRALATGIAVCGSGIGTFIFSPVSQLLIDNYGWRGSILIQAAIILNCAGISGLFRPLESKRRRRKVSDPPVDENPVDVRRMSLDNNKVNNSVHRRTVKQKPLLQRMKEFRDNNRWDSESSIDNNSDREDGAGTNDDVREVSEGNPSHDNPSQQSDSNENYLNRSQRRPEQRNDGELRVDLQRQRVGSRPDEFRSDRVEEYSDLERRASFFGFTTEQPSAAPKKSVLPKVNSGDLARPFYRQDIFFSGSLLRIPEYASSQSDLSLYHRKVSRIPGSSLSVKAAKEANEETDGKPSSCQWFSCSPHMKETFKAMLDLSLMKSPTFIIICISGFLTFLGFFIPFVYLSEFAQSTGTPKDKSAFLLSLIGITNTAGRVFSGWITDRPQVNSLYFNVGALALSGIVTALVPLCVTYATQIVYSVTFGLSIACYVSLRSIVLVDLLGLEKLTNSFGLTLLFQGTASLIGPPLAGWFYDQTGLYDTSFYLAGVLVTVSGLMWIPLPAMSRWEARREKMKNAKKSLVEMEEIKTES